MDEYISRDKINEAFDSIWDCADMVFEPDDHCCSADDCGHCKWLQTKNAIKKKLDHIPPADVRPVVRGEWVEDDYGFIRCSNCGMEWDEPEHPKTNYCPNCGAKIQSARSRMVESINNAIKEIREAIK